MSSSTLAAGLRHLRGQLAAQQCREDSDEHLLHAFLSRGDDSAFTVLVRRHGPMVLHVCRRVLGHVQDAEDAFQATFLVLARNAASLRDKTSLASFLYGTAYRIAMKAKQTAARRRKHEGQTPPRPPVSLADELSLPGAIKGRLVDDDGKPLAGMEIDLRYRDRAAEKVHNSVQHYEGRGPILTDAAGAFAYDDVIPGMTFELSYRPNKRRSRSEAQSIGKAVQVKPGECRDLGAIKRQRLPERPKK